MLFVKSCGEPSFVVCNCVIKYHSHHNALRNAESQNEIALANLKIKVPRLIYLELSLWGIMGDWVW